MIMKIVSYSYSIAIFCTILSAALIQPANAFQLSRFEVFAPQSGMSTQSWFGLFCIYLQP
jgi:hypothetical protein